MMKKQIFIITTILLFAMCGKRKKERGECPYTLFHKRDDRLTLNNNSSKTIVAQASYLFPDTTLSSINQPTPEFTLNTVNSKENSSIVFQRNQPCWEGVFEREIPSGQLQIFLFDKDVLNNNTWDDVKTNYKVYKRLTYTLQQLKDKNWQIEVN